MSSDKFGGYGHFYNREWTDGRGCGGCQPATKAETGAEAGGRENAVSKRFGWYW